MREARNDPACRTSGTGPWRRIDITDGEMIRWPDPSPLQPWWDSVMNGEITMRSDKTIAAHSWLIRCDRCDHRFGAVAANQHDADRAARTNGWVVDAETLCPGCAHVAQTQSQAASAAGAA